MHPQIAALVTEFEDATRHVHRLAYDVPEDGWATRPSPDRWSIAENVAHLNLTSAAYMPLLDDLLVRARELGRPAPRRFRKDFFGWMIWRTQAPGGGVRAKTTAAFIPEAIGPRDQLLHDFDRLQGELLSRLRAGQSLPIHRVRIRSPFDARLRYSGYSAFAILARHEHRHLQQADAAWRDVKAGRTAGR